MSSTRGRCSEHDLALGPNGECILCRRAHAPARRGGGGSSTLKLVFGVLLAAAAVTASYRVLRRAERLLDPPPPPAPVVAPVAAAPESPVAPEPPRRPSEPRSPTPSEPRAPTPTEAPQPPSPSVREEPDRYALLAARRRVSITMYSTSWCGVCRSARAYMDAEGIAYVDHDVEADARAARRLRSLNPRGSVPTFDIDGETHIGFSPRSFRIWIDEAARRHL